MWLLVAREPRADAMVWSGRLWLAALDALLWPALWVWVIHHLPGTLGVVAPFVTGVAALSALGRLHRAVWVNHRYWFTTWRWARIVGGLMLVGLVMKVAAGA